MGVAKRREDRRLMMFGDGHSMWTGGRLTQEQAAELLGVSARTFRRWTDRYGEDGIEGLRDRRVSRASHRAAPVDEVMRMVDRYQSDHDGWNARHYYSWCRRGAGRGATTGSGTGSRSTGRWRGKRAAAGTGGGASRRPGPG